MLPEKNVYWKDIPEHATIELIGNIYVATWLVKVYSRRRVVYWTDQEAEQAHSFLSSRARLAFDEEKKTNEVR